MMQKCSNVKCVMWQRLWIFVPRTGQAEWAANMPTTSLIMQQHGEMLQCYSLICINKPLGLQWCMGLKAWLRGRENAQQIKFKAVTQPKRYPLTCTAFTGGSLRTSAWAQIPVDRCLRRGQHPIVTEGGCRCRQGLAAQSCTWLVHGIGVGHRHRHVHGEVLLGQCCRLQRQRHRHSHTNTQNVRADVLFEAATTRGKNRGFALSERYIR